MPNPITNQVISRRLQQAAIAAERPQIEWACRWGDDGPLPRRDDVEESDYLAAKTIIEQTIAQGERRFKTPLEFWLAFNALPPEAQERVLKWKAIVELRELAMGRADLMDEVMYQTCVELAAEEEEIYMAMAVAGQLDFDATEVIGG